MASGHHFAGIGNEIDAINDESVDCYASAIFYNHLTFGQWSFIHDSSWST